MKKIEASVLTDTGSTTEVFDPRELKLVCGYSLSGGCNCRPQNAQTKRQPPLKCLPTRDCGAYIDRRT